jgi:hypothetical protein
MKLDEAMELVELKGKGGFDYRFWYWAKKGSSSYGLAYARQSVNVDLPKVSRDAEEALKNIAMAVDELDKLSPEEQEKQHPVMERKQTENVKRLKTMVDQFGSPIVVHWLSSIPTEKAGEELKEPTGERPTIVTVPLRRKNDVTDYTGEDLNFALLYRQSNTKKAIEMNVKWNALRINDKEGDTQNTLIAKFAKEVITKHKKAREPTYGRSTAIPEIMKHLHFTDENTGVEIRPFSETDYKLIQNVGTDIGKLREVVKNKFPLILKRAREVFSK